MNPLTFIGHVQGDLPVIIEAVQDKSQLALPPPEQRKFLARTSEDSLAQRCRLREVQQVLEGECKRYVLIEHDGHTSLFIFPVRLCL